MVHARCAWDGVDPPPLCSLRCCLLQAPIKAVLLDQERVVCGVGNWVADEVLFHSAVYPGTPAGALSDAQVCITGLWGAFRSPFPCSVGTLWRSERPNAGVVTGLHQVLEVLLGLSLLSVLCMKSNCHEQCSGVIFMDPS